MQLTTTRRGMRALAATTVVAVCLAAAMPAQAGSAVTLRPGETILASATPEGMAGNGPSGDGRGTAISGDGRFVAFHSPASDLVEGDTNGAYDVFVRDLEAGVVERVSVSSSGEQGNKSSFRPSLSDDGRYVVFDSRATNFDPRMPTKANMPAVFRHDRHTGETVLVSVARDGGPINDVAAESTVSADGNVVAFTSDATNLVATATPAGVPQVYIRDIAAGTTELASVSNAGVAGNAPSFGEAISADGRFVAFHTLAANLAPGTGAMRFEVFVHDRQTGTTTLVSADRDGTPRGGNVPSLSADGRYIAFDSGFAGYVPNGSPMWSQVFVKDMTTGDVRAATVRTDATPATGYANNPEISSDGRYVAFHYIGRDVAAGMETVPGSRASIVVHDLLTGASERVSVPMDGQEVDAHSWDPRISADGRRIVFESAATTLAPGADGKVQTWVRDRGPAVGTVGPVTSRRDGDTLEVRGAATFSGVVITEATAEEGPQRAIRQAVDADLASAQVIYRPEQRDLLVRLGLSDLRDHVLGAGPLGRTYALHLSTGGQDYEVRIIPHVPRLLAEVPIGGRTAQVSLHRCEVTCTEVASLTGNVGVAGRTAVAVVPLDALGIAEGAHISAVRAVIAVGESSLTGPTLDELTVPDAVVPQRRVDLRLPGAAAQTKSTLAPGGVFLGHLPLSGGGVEPSQVEVEACLGSRCATSDVQLR